MSKYRFNIIFILLLLSVSVQTLYSQRNKSKNNLNSTTFLNIAFDSSTAQLKKNFLGHNLKVIYSKLEARNEGLSEKKAFEKTEEFLKRKTSESSKPIYDNIFMESTLAFVLKDCPSVYNADKEMLKVICPFSKSIDFKLASDYRSFTWKSDIIKDDSYFGTNAFGASVTVYREEKNYYNLAINNRNIKTETIPGSFDFSQTGFSVDIPLSVPEAKIVWSTISAILICQLIEPYCSYNREYNRATFDFPYETTNDYYYVYVKIKELWFVNTATGKIYLKLKIYSPD
jgi:hypothetical protein